jgi:hypothetical protein
LHFRELVNIQEKVVRLMYSYHYQGGNNQLIFCYDDIPHHPELAGFPYHKHAGLDANPATSEPLSFAEVLAEIELIFLLRK